MADVEQKPSQSYNLVYLAFGYTLASLYITWFGELSIQDRVLVSVPIGGLFGTFLFYLKPEILVIEALLRLRGWGGLLSSSLLSQTRAYITGALYFVFSLAAAIHAQSRLSLSPDIVIILYGGLVLVAARLSVELRRLPPRLLMVRRYNTVLRSISGIGKVRVDYEYGNSTLSRVRSAVVRGDWNEAASLLDQMWLILGLGSTESA
jgi:hypothetical protein